MILSVLTGLMLLTSSGLESTVGERRALVIGASNDRFGALDFIAQVARELHAAVTSPEMGDCRSALPGGRDLLIGDAASYTGIREALHDAMRAAALDQATLFIYFVGHGYREAEDFYLIASDTPGLDRIDSDTAVAIGQRIKELLRQNATIDGVMLVLDACHSGSAVTDPVPGLLRSGVTARMEVLAATREDQTASNGCFSRSITALLRRGSSSSPDRYLRAYDEYARLREVAPTECQTMPTPIHVSLSGGIDAGLWLGHNRAADIRPALVNADASSEVARLTRNLVHTRYLTDLLTLRWSGRSPIAVTGGPGTGKSTLLAALGRTSLAGVGGVDALVMVRPGDSLADVAAAMSSQLQVSASYQSAFGRWVQNTPALERTSEPLFTRLVAGPVSSLQNGETIFVAVDGLDKLPTLARRRLLEAFTGHTGAVLLVAGREASDVPQEASLRLPGRSPEAVASLLAALLADDEERHRIEAVCAGDWLLARILASLSRVGAVLK